MERSKRIVSEKFQDDFNYCQDMTPRMGSDRCQETAKPVVSQTGRKPMTQWPTTETKVSEPGRTTPECLLKWTIDPETGKPIGRWVAAERAETVSVPALRSAA
jgi:hypothetical protein